MGGGSTFFSETCLTLGVSCNVLYLLSFKYQSFTFSRLFYLSRATYNKYICKKKEKHQSIAVGTVRKFIETSAKHIQLLG